MQRCNMRTIIVACFVAAELLTVAPAWAGHEQLSMPRERPVCLPGDGGIVSTRMDPEGAALGEALSHLKGEEFNRVYLEEARHIVEAQKAARRADLQHTAVPRVSPLPER